MIHLLRTFLIAVSTLAIAVPQIGVGACCCARESGGGCCKVRSVKKAETNCCCKRKAPPADSCCRQSPESEQSQPRDCQCKSHLGEPATKVDARDLEADVHANTFAVAQDPTAAQKTARVTQTLGIGPPIRVLSCVWRI